MPLYKHLLALFVLTLAVYSQARGQDSSAPHSPIAADVCAAVTRLRDTHSTNANPFVVQSELDTVIREGGGGACASAAAVDAIQVLRTMAGRGVLNNPHRAVLAAFSNQPELLNGRVTNDQLRRLIAFYDERYFDEATIDCQIQSAINSRYASNGERWSGELGPDLSLAPNQLKLISYTVSPKDSEPLGRHFVLLVAKEDDEIVVLDPARPEKDHRYRIEFKGGGTSPRKRAFLLRPPGVPPSPNVSEINTVFTFTVVEDGSSAQAKNASLSVEDVKARISKLAEELRPTDDFVSPRVWRKRGADFGLPALDLPRAYGGSEWTASQTFEVFRHAGRFNLNFRDIVGAAHARVLLKSKNPEILEIVKQIARGDGYMAIAITEPEVGSNVAGIKSAARKAEGGYLLSGVKRFNARLEQASHVIIFTQGTTGKAGKLSVFVVPIDHPGLKLETLTAHGLTGNSFGGLTFDEMFVPDAYMVGDDGEGLKTFFEHFLYWRLMQSAAAIGTGEQALEQMAERLKTREAFGGPIGRFTHLQQQLGQFTIELRMATALAREAAKRIDDHGYDRETRALICGLKAEGVEIAQRAVDAAVRAFGGEGYSTLVDVGDRLRDLHGLRIADGTTDVMRMEVVRHIYGDEFWDMAIQHRP